MEMETYGLLGRNTVMVQSACVCLSVFLVLLCFGSECCLTLNLSGAIIEMAAGVIPSICSFTNEVMAMSGRPAVEEQRVSNSQVFQRHRAQS